MGFQVHGQFIHHLVGPLGHHHIRHFKLGVFHSLFDQVGFVVGLCPLSFCLFQTVHGLFPEFSHSLAVAVGSDQFVGNFGNFLHFHILHIDFEHSLLAGQFLGEVVFREGCVHIRGFTLFQANQLVFEAGDEAVAAHFQRIALAFAAFESFAVNGAGKVDDGQVAFFQSLAFRSFHHLGSPFLQVFHFLVHVSVSDFLFVLGNVQVFVLTQFRFRTQGDHQGHFHGLTFFELGIFDFRIGNGNPLVFFQGFSIFTVGSDFESFFFDGIFAHVHFQHTAGSFALTEARDGNLFVDLGNGFFKSLGYVFYRQSDFQGCFITFSFYGNAHLKKSSSHAVSHSHLSCLTVCL